MNGRTGKLVRGGREKVPAGFEATFFAAPRNNWPTCSPYLKSLK